jgi:hypothetical protein
VKDHQGIGLFDAAPQFLLGVRVERDDRGQVAQNSLLDFK